MADECWRNKQDTRQHDWLYVSVLLSTILIYTITVGFNVIPSGTTLIPNNVGNLSYTDFRIDITPAGFVFAVNWSLIFFFQFVWLIYNFICIFRTNSDGQLLYRTVNFLPMGTLIAFMVNNLQIIAWIFLFSNKYAGWALIPIVGSTLSLHVAMFMSLRSLYRSKDQLVKLGCKKDVWLTRFLVQNSMGLFLTWLSLASNLNFAIFLAYSAGVAVPTASSVALIIILLVIVVYFVLENFVWQRYLLFMFTPWFIVLLALIGSISRNWNASSPSNNNILTLAMLIIAACLAITKGIMFILYQTKLKDRVDSAFCSRKNHVASADIEIGDFIKRDGSKDDQQS